MCGTRRQGLSWNGGGGQLCVSDVGINKMTHIQIRLAHPLVLYCVYARE